MARILVLSASRLYVSTSAWNRILLSLGAQTGQIELLPIPSNVPQADAQDTAKMRKRVLGPDSQLKLVGHFGTYGKWVGELLYPILAELLRGREDVHLLLIGDGSQEFRLRILKEFTTSAHRVTATGRRELKEIASFISSCDVMVQPYRDGVNTRRGSLMACLINGKAVVTNMGENSESLWRENGVAIIVNGCGPLEYTITLSNVLGDLAKLNATALQSQAYYDQEFEIQTTVSRLIVEIPRLRLKKKPSNSKEPKDFA